MAEPGVPPVSMQGLRNTLRVHIEESSLRQVARVVRISPTGLSQFLLGAEPYTPVRGKLDRWWKEKGHLPLETVPPELARLAVADLLRLLPDDEAEPLARQLVEIVAGEHADCEVAPPGWLAELSTEHGDEGDDTD